ncbi:MAG: hypothetical protein QF516_09215, partial [Pirellulaceae bacterium]|nr:hypothetical protein [Pirellulaceae bacterium]
MSSHITLDDIDGTAEFFQTTIDGPSGIVFRLLQGFRPLFIRLLLVSIFLILSGRFRGLGFLGLSLVSFGLVI